MMNYCRHEKERHSRVFVANWLLGTICNYRCRYCNENLYAGQKAWVDVERCEKMVDIVFQHCQRVGMEPYFDITGGEVTLFRPLPRLLRYIKERGGKTGIITNGSAKPEVMAEILRSLDHACVSYHPASAKDERFVEVVDAVRSVASCHVNIMADPNMLDRVEAICRRLHSMEDITISIQPLLEKLGSNGKMMAYAEEQRRLIEELESSARNVMPDEAYTYRGRMEFLEPPAVLSVPQIVNAQLNRWKGWVCHTGVESVVIDEKGGVYNGWCKQEFYGSFFDDPEIRIPTLPLVCRKDRCLCNLDILATKHVGMEAAAEETDYRGRFKESFREGVRRWDLGEGFEVDGEIVVEFRVASRWHLAKVGEELVEIDLIVEHDQGGVRMVERLRTRILHMSGEVLPLIRGPKTIRSIAAANSEEGIVAALKLHRLTERGAARGRSGADGDLVAPLGRVGDVEACRA